MVEWGLIVWHYWLSYYYCQNYHWYHLIRSLRKWEAIKSILLTRVSVSFESFFFKKEMLKRFHSNLLEKLRLSSICIFQNDSFWKLRNKSKQKSCYVFLGKLALSCKIKQDLRRLWQMMHKIFLSFIGLITSEKLVCLHAEMAIELGKVTPKKFPQQKNNFGFF